mgnify:CR=1 FL=1
MYWSEGKSDVDFILGKKAINTNSDISIIIEKYIDFQKNINRKLKDKI